MTQGARYIVGSVGDALSMVAGGLVTPGRALPRPTMDDSGRVSSALGLLDLDAALAQAPHGDDASVIRAPCLMKVSRKALNLAFPSGPPTSIVGVLPLEVIESIAVGGEEVISGITALPVANIDARRLKLEAMDMDHPDTLELGADVAEIADDLDGVGLAEAVATANRVAGALTLLINRGPIGSASVTFGESMHAAWIAGADTPALAGALAAGCEGDGSAELALLRAVLDILGRQDANAVLDANGILSELIAEDPHPGATESLRYMMSVVRAEREIARFPDNPGLTAARGLLMFLLRPEPDEVVTWSRDDLNAGEPAMALATVLAGYRKGYRDLSLENRGSPTLRDWMQRQLANTVNSRIGAQIEPIRKDYPLRGKLEETDNTVRIRFTSYRLKLSEREQARDLPIRSRLLSGEDLPGVLEQIASALGWNDLEITVIRTSAHFSVELNSDGIEIHVRGPAELEKRFDAGLARERLAELDDETVEGALARVGNPNVGAASTSSDRDQ